MNYQVHPVPLDCHQSYQEATKNTKAKQTQSYRNR